MRWKPIFGGRNGFISYQHQPQNGTLAIRLIAIEPSPTPPITLFYAEEPAGKDRQRVVMEPGRLYVVQGKEVSVGMSPMEDALDWRQATFCIDHPFDGGVSVF